MITMEPEVADIEGGIEIQYCDGTLGASGCDPRILFSSGALDLGGKDDVGIG